MRWTQRKTDVVCLVIGAISTITMLIHHLIGLATGHGLNIVFYINATVLIFGWIVVGQKWRNPRLHLIPGIEASSFRSLHIIVGVAVVIWLISCVLSPGLTCFVAGLVTIAALREIGSRRAPTTS